MDDQELKKLIRQGIENVSGTVVGPKERLTGNRLEDVVESVFKLLKPRIRDWEDQSYNSGIRKIRS